VQNFVFLCICQIALVDVLRTLGIEPDGILGHSAGEVGCAYADGGLTAEQTLLAAYWRGQCVSEANLPAGGMAAVGECGPALTVEKKSDSSYQILNNRSH